MKRTAFLTSLAALVGTPLLSRAQQTAYKEAGFINLGYGRSPRIPPYLQPGDTIGITSPAGYILLTDIQPAITQLQAWGFTVKVGSTIGKRDFTFGGTDTERAADFQQLLDDDTVKAILCARGGYGMVRMIDRLNFKKFIQQPKWLIGFSDVTVLHSHLNRQCNVASIHAKMCNSFPKDPTQAEPIQTATILSIQQALTGTQMQYMAPANPANRLGSTTGILTGGNLKTLETLAGTPSDFDASGCMLFVEDTGEYLYSIDRMFWNLKRSGKLAKLKALVVGGFKTKQEDPGDEFGRSLQDIVLEVVKAYRYPVCFDFPVGHQKNNMALKCGVLHQLEVSETGSSLTEVRK